MVDCVHDPNKELLQAEAFVIHTNLVEHGISKQVLGVFTAVIGTNRSIFLKFKVVNGIPHDRQGCHSDVVHLINVVLIEHLT